MRLFRRSSSKKSSETKNQRKTLQKSKSSKSTTPETRPKPKKWNSYRMSRIKDGKGNVVPDTYSGQNVWGALNKEWSRSCEETVEILTPTRSKKILNSDENTDATTISSNNDNQAYEIILRGQEFPVDNTTTNNNSAITTTSSNNNNNTDNNNTDNNKTQNTNTSLTTSPRKSYRRYDDTAPTETGSAQDCSPLNDWSSFVSLLTKPSMDGITDFFFPEEESVNSANRKKDWAPPLREIQTSMPLPPRSQLQSSDTVAEEQKAQNILPFDERAEEDPTIRDDESYKQSPQKQKDQDDASEGQRSYPPTEQYQISDSPSVRSSYHSPSPSPSPMRVTRSAPLLPPAPIASPQRQSSLSDKSDVALGTLLSSEDEDDDDDEEEEDLFLPPLIERMNQEETNGNELNSNSIMPSVQEEEEEEGEGEEGSPGLPDEEVYDMAFTLRFLRELTQTGVMLVYFQDSDTSTDDDMLGSSFVNMCIKPGVTRGSKLLEPKLSWTEMKSARSLGEDAISINLLGIHSIKAPQENENDEQPNQSESPFFIITTESGDVHVFEAPTISEQNHIVHGLKNVVAWLSYHLVLGSMASSGSELVSDLDEEHGEMSGELPSLRTPVQAMNDLTHSFLD